MAQKRKLKKGIKKTLIFFRLILLVLFLSGFFYYGLDKYKKHSISNINRDVVKKLDYKVDLSMLVNYEHKIPKDYDLRLRNVEGNKEVATILYNDLNRMITLAKNEDGVEIKINSAYRPNNIQKDIFDSYVKDYQKQGYSYSAAVQMTKISVAEPGYSEHETGLAIDFSESGNTVKNTKMWNWLAKNAYKYGFIKRYPSDKTNITKVKYEPWHYRYVGIELAKEIYDSNLTLEEYHEQNKK